MAVKRKVVFITGGMSGIGHCLAGKYAARGCDVGVLDLAVDESKRSAIERLCAGPDQRVRAWKADVTDAAGVKAAIDAAVAELGAPDLVVNSAGIQRAGEILAQPVEEFELVVRVNLFGSRNVAAAALPLLRPGSKLVFVASMAAVAPGYGYTAYGSSKAGVLAFAEALRSELAPRRIAVAVVCPPEVATPLVAWSRTVRPAPTEQLTRFAGSLGLDEACDAILDGILGRSFLVIPGRRAKLAYLLSRLLPKRVAHAISDRIVARALAS